MPWSGEIMKNTDFNMTMKWTFANPLETRLSPIDSDESQLSIGANLVSRRQVLTHFMAYLKSVDFGKDRFLSKKHTIFTKIG